jgi:hypothetical protein
MRKINESIIKDAVLNAKNITQVMKNLKRADSSAGRLIVKRHIVDYNIDTSHFETHKERYERNLNSFVKLPNEKIFIEHSTYNSGNKIKDRLYDGGLKKRECEKCGQNENWNGEYMSLILDHINGIHDDNRLENLRILCPNCNATLPTHCRGNKKLKKQQQNDVSLTENKTNHYKKISYSQRKVKRPEYIELKEDIKNLGYLATGRKYGVSDNAIRKWIKFYEKY